MNIDNTESEDWEVFKKHCKPIKQHKIETTNKSKNNQENTLYYSNYNNYDNLNETFIHNTQNHVHNKYSISKSPIQLDPFSCTKIPKPQLLDIKKGKIIIEDIIDLHGYNINEAFNAVCNFIDYNIHKKRRVILCITGKGTLSKKTQTYTIKEKFQYWVYSNPQLSKHIKYCSTAHIKHGGEGAFYLFLKW